MEAAQIDNDSRPKLTLVKKSPAKPIAAFTSKQTTVEQTTQDENGEVPKADTSPSADSYHIVTNNAESQKISDVRDAIAEEQRLTQEALKRKHELPAYKKIKHFEEVKHETMDSPILIPFKIFGKYRFMPSSMKYAAEIAGLNAAAHTDMLSDHTKVLTSAGTSAAGAVMAGEALRLVSKSADKHEQQQTAKTLAQAIDAVQVSGTYDKDIFKQLARNADDQIPDAVARSLIAGEKVEGDYALDPRVTAAESLIRGRLDYVHNDYMHGAHAKVPALLRTTREQQERRKIVADMLAGNRRAIEEQYSSKDITKRGLKKFGDIASGFPFVAGFTHLVHGISLGLEGVSHHVDALSGPAHGLGKAADTVGLVADDAFAPAANRVQ